jgi:hypothetical protein
MRNGEFQPALTIEQGSEPIHGITSWLSRVRAGPLVAICCGRLPTAGPEPSVKLLDKHNPFVIKDCTFHTSASAAIFVHNN